MKYQISKNSSKIEREKMCIRSWVAFRLFHEGLCNVPLIKVTGSTKGDSPPAFFLINRSSTFTIFNANLWTIIIMTATRRNLAARQNGEVRRRVGNFQPLSHFLSGLCECREELFPFFFFMKTEKTFSIVWVSPIRGFYFLSRMFSEPFFCHQFIPCGSKQCTQTHTHTRRRCASR